MKSIKALIHSLIVAHICRAFRALRRVKSILLQALNAGHNSKQRKKVFFGSFRLHYNWGSTSSSRVLPVPESVLRGCSSDSYVEGSSSTTAACQWSSSESTLAGYLLWLEEKDNKCAAEGGVVVNEIDRLAEMFIAECHEKFQLEKQESLRRFHDMMARSM
ncbi:unnamed protein product [Linum tenue]|uniref:DUF761 domain-containing protein n=1 Tax=Linum tenue TaxID=586396 RepID=A0AAV0IZF6_9ROSI|nr:unnamed protein product [Linum tenue]